MKKLTSVKEFIGLHKRLFIHILNLSLLIFFINANCNKNDVITPEDTDITNESAMTRVSTELLKVLCNANTYLIMVANNVNSISGNCPTVTFNSSTITVDYGSGACAGDIDSIRRTGSYSINYYISSNSDSLAASIIFNNYGVYKVKGTSTDTNLVTMSGINNFYSKNSISESNPYISNYQSVFYSADNFSTNSGKQETVSLSLTATIVINNPQSFTDYNFYLKGSGSAVNQTANISYNYTIDPSFPLNYETTCGYPISGKVYLDLNGNRFTVDYSPNNNNCDDVVSITKFGTTKYANLSSVDF